MWLPWLGLGLLPWLLSAIAAIAVSGLPGAMLSRNSRVGQWVATLLVGAGSALGITCVLIWLAADGSLDASFPWSVMPEGTLDIRLHVGVDGISALFLLPIFLIGLLGSIYGLDYWKQTEHLGNGRKLRLFYGLCVAGMALLVVARDSVVFLVGWEVMALSAFFLVATEDEQESAREAGWIYLALTHTATLVLFAMFALLWAATQSGELVPQAGAAPMASGMATTIFMLALVGFGIKAGVMPLHVWLPGAHANAPSHVSALMSGVLIKMGIYGLVRISSFFPQPPVWWGGLVLTLGVISGVLGVAYAIGQHDLKRLLAYHSIENIGMIVMGLGLALVGRSLERFDWVVLGMGGALLHVWNHALFKSLLFYSAGAVVHAVHTREMDELGGLSKRMPYTACCFLVGAVAICGLPPLNGFVSEFLIYNGLFRTLGIGEGAKWPAAALAAPGLALIGALAAACFIKAFGTVFLGTGRSEHARHAHEAPVSMILPMLVLAVGCAAIGFAPRGVAGVLDRAIVAWTTPAGSGAVPQEVALATSSVYPLADWQPLGSIAVMALALAGATAVVGIVLWVRMRGGGVESSATWGCGYSSPTPRMQYTSSSFAEMLVSQFRWALWPIVRRPRIGVTFPRDAHFESEVPEGVLDRLVMPAARWLARRLSWFRVFQQGSAQAYLLYIFAIVILLLIWP
ncbi:MAG TPA: proton-conducting transporter membrane subunit [Pirellulales bacterium]|nr:proton-conducting transporter membrane subunit [Pirellulales bacterium]